MKHSIWEGAATLVILFLVLSAVSYQENNVDDRVSMRLGGGDTSYEILQSISYGEEITSKITNLDDSLNLSFTIIWVEESVYAMERGVINWSKIEENYTTYTVKPGETMEIPTDDPKKWHLMILHNSAEDLDDVIEVRILNDYGEDVMWKAVALSIPLSLIHI